MTAPLPPLPQLAVWTPGEVKTYAKLAVRQALKRVEENLINADDGGHWYAKELARIPRAMIEEYE